MRVVSILPQNGSHNFPTRVREMPAALKRMNQQLTFPRTWCRGATTRRRPSPHPTAARRATAPCARPGSEPAATAGPARVTRPRYRFGTWMSVLLSVCGRSVNTRSRTRRRARCGTGKGLTPGTST
ncbi:MAG: esterase [Streptomyces oryziradicis]|nr:esterase [Actinacidiphila oryziradicis]